MLNSITQTSALWPLLRHWRWRRAPVLLQLNDIECGAVCLAMILNYHGRPTRVAECKAEMGIGRDGITARTIADSAHKYGLRVRAFSLESTDFAALPLPAIAHWNFNHFVVVERWSAQAVDIIDPAVGRRLLTTQEFEAAFTGVKGMATLKVAGAENQAFDHWANLFFKVSIQPPANLTGTFRGAVCLQVTSETWEYGKCRSSLMQPE
jgi:ABC-type bacteriocin/lantibiotic exporter with double-glycine peptidase domain